MIFRSTTSLLLGNLLEINTTPGILNKNFQRQHVKKVDRDMKKNVKHH